MNHHDNKAAWTIILLAAIFHAAVAAAAVHAIATNHATPVAAILVGAPSIIALAAGALGKAASRTMPPPAR